MSLRYEMVLTCFLKDDTPESVLDALRWHMGLRADRPGSFGPDGCPHPLLTPTSDSDTRLAGGEFARLTHQSRGSHDVWGLFVRVLWPDDILEESVTILELLAPHVDEPGYGGYFREEADAWPSVYMFREGTYDVTGPMSDFRSGRN
ncbi:hypothetical protein [Streptomyces sp. UH6]|uniref:hypothetical protein n=1 Tax=Streptomyces sp. UH6 TaxID=2748379 RepID=UPI0015D4E430|nr:hypothetical protein [Streptomyces sp. UH6]NYV74589.1 hypothetical protein [Streptomyces sp. UH6]